MADSKYANLPYIAQDQPDVYETNDLPEADQNLVYQNIDDTVVETLAVDPKEAFLKFKYSTLDPLRTDFSDSLKKASHCSSGYAARSEYEVLACEERGQETPLQRLQRLQLEMQQLTEDVETIRKASAAGSSLSCTPSDFLSQVELLQHQLNKFVLENTVGLENASILSDPDAIQYKRLLEDLRSFKPSAVDASKPAASGVTTSVSSQPSRDQVVYELYYRHDVAQQTKAAKVAELEQRLHKLESTLGPYSDKFPVLAKATNGSTLMDCVAGLSARLSLLNTDEVDKMEMRLALLDQSLTRTVEKKTTIEAQRLDKVTDLYEMMKKWDNVVDVVPDLIDRLTVLQELHQHAMQFSASVAHLDSTQQELTKNLRFHQDLLKQVEEQFAKNIGILEANCKTIDTRLKSIAKK